MIINILNKKKRFSKKALIEELEAVEKNLREHYGFVTTTGWAQVQRRDTATITEYGRWNAIWQLLQELYALGGR